MNAVQNSVDLMRDLWRISRYRGRGRIHRANLLSTYLRLKFCEWLRVRRQVEKLFGCRVRFFDYQSLTFLFKSIFIYGEYNADINTKAPVIVDCGSNVGLSILNFKLRYPGAKILGFEPDGRTFAALKDNVEGNRLQDVVVRNTALADAPGVIEFFDDEERPGGHNMSILSQRGPKRRQEVQAETLSSHIQGEVDLLKMDIEGAELMVMTELQRAGCLKHVRRIALEYHHHITPDSDNLSEMLGILEREGFGYQLRAHLAPPARDSQYQDVMIHAYRKT